MSSVCHTDELIRDQIVALLPRLFRFALSLTGSQAHADDLVQDTCERAIARLHQWERGTRLDSWLFRIAQNIHRSGRRDSANRLRILDELGVARPSSLDGEAIADRHTELTRVREWIFELPEEQREVLVIVCVLGYSYQEAADIFDLPIGTVRSRLARARETLMKRETEGGRVGMNRPGRRATA